MSSSILNFFLCNSVSFDQFKRFKMLIRLEFNCIEIYPTFEVDILTASLHSDRLFEEKNYVCKRKTYKHINRKDVFIRN